MGKSSILDRLGFPIALGGYLLGQVGISLRSFPRGLCKITLCTSELINCLLFEMVASSRVAMNLPLSNEEQNAGDATLLQTKGQKAGWGGSSSSSFKMFFFCSSVSSFLIEIFAVYMGKKIDDRFHFFLPRWNVDFLFFTFKNPQEVFSVSTLILWTLWRLCWNMPWRLSTLSRWEKGQTSFELENTSFLQRCFELLNLKQPLQKKQEVMVLQF